MYKPSETITWSSNYASWLIGQRRKLSPGSNSIGPSKLCQRWAIVNPTSDVLAHIYLISYSNWSRSFSIAYILPLYQASNSHSESKFSTVGWDNEHAEAKGIQQPHWTNPYLIRYLQSITAIRMYAHSRIISCAAWAATFITYDVFLTHQIKVPTATTYISSPRKNCCS
jgi:hypothetical protein